MKIEDLRIGNLVSVNNKQFHPNLKGAILRVTGLHERSRNGVVEASVNLECERETYSQFIEYIKPVVLTEQWLLDFGFEDEGGDDYIVTKGEYTLLLTVEKASIRVFLFHLYGTYNSKHTFLKDILYVHQLQNLYFALMQEELILKERSKQ